MELKQELAFLDGVKLLCFNRTFMELKQAKKDNAQASDEF